MLNEGLRASQEASRKDTYQKIDAAVQYLKEHGLSITKTSVAEEAGISRCLMYKGHVKAYLLQYPEFNPNIQIKSPENYLEEVKLLRAENKKLKEQLSSSQNYNKSLRLKNIELTNKVTETETKYKHLLGKYQTDMSNKLVRF